MFRHRPRQRRGVAGETAIVALPWTRPPSLLVGIALMLQWMRVETMGLFRNAVRDISIILVAVLFFCPASVAGQWEISQNYGKWWVFGEEHPMDGWQYIVVSDDIFPLRMMPSPYDETIAEIRWSCGEELDRSPVLTDSSYEDDLDLPVFHTDLRGRVEPDVPTLVAIQHRAYIIVRNGPRIGPLRRWRPPGAGMLSEEILDDFGLVRLRWDQQRPIVVKTLRLGDGMLRLFPESSTLAASAGIELSDFLEDLSQHSTLLVEIPWANEYRDSHFRIPLDGAAEAIEYAKSRCPALENAR